MKKLNVLQFICPSGFYGAEMWILALAKNLNRQRVNCRLAITLESEEQNMELYNRFLSLGLSANRIRMRGRFNPVVIARLCALIKNENIDIIHTHGYKSDLLGLIASRISGIKAVATPHGFENAPNRKLQLFIRLGCFAHRFFEKVAPLSEGIEADLRRFKVPNGKIKRIMNGVDLDEVEEVRKKQYDPVYANNGEKKIGYIGQIAYRKNIGDLIKIFDSLYKEQKNIRLVIIGDGPQRTELEERCSDLPSGKKIAFLGYRNDRLRYLKEMNIFAMTSSLEGIPRCMMEAMAMGIPVTAYEIPGIDKLIIQNQTGLMAPFGNIEELKESWKRLLFDEPFSARIAQNGRRHVFENFSAKRMAEEYTQLYEEMVSGKR